LTWRKGSENGEENDLEGGTGSKEGKAIKPNGTGGSPGFIKEENPKKRQGKSISKESRINLRPYRGKRKTRERGG